MKNFRITQLGICLSMSFFNAAAFGQATVPLSVTSNLAKSIPQTVIVEFKDRSVKSAAIKNAADRGLKTLDASALAQLRTGYSSVKSRALFGLTAGITKKYDYEYLPMAALTVTDRNALSQLAARSDVAAIYENKIHKPVLAQSLPQIKANIAASLGKTGTGTTVAVLDTGVDFTRPAFGSCTTPNFPVGCRVNFAQDFAPNDGQRDANGHGTNVAGIVAGVAPGTRIAALDVFNGGGAFSADIISAINWSIANRAAFNIVAMNLSLGWPTSNTFECAGSWATTPFANARAAGIIPVVASGNDGFTNGIAEPACAPGAVSVGAVYDYNGTYSGSCSDTTWVDKVTCFSNSSPYILSLLAPGSSITAAGITMSGTSQAAPHVAGAVAILRAGNAFPNENLSQTINRLVTTGNAVTNTRNGAISPRINLQTALAAPRSDLIFSRWVTRQGGYWDQQQWVSGDFNGDNRDDLAKAFNCGNGLGCIDVHLSNGTTFIHQRWATNQGGYWDAQKWMSGDFNGDGRTDMAKSFNCGNGLGCIDVHLSNGAGSFIHQRWATNQGGYWDAQKWMSGDFNGDGRTDLAKTFNCGNGSGCIDVHLSNGATFTHQRWATNQGGYWDTQKWMAADFNGDGRTDLAKTFNCGNGTGCIDVHPSTVGGFLHQRWATNQGGYWDTQKWVAGDFNNDGRADLAKAFNDGGLISIDIHYAFGKSFNMTREETRKGGFWDSQKWLSGDFNGNNVADMANVFNDAGMADIDVHKRFSIIFTFPPIIFTSDK